ncbi:MAG: hypothetical protein ACTSPB_06275 [Candidatus Thorarchaeota archaeon]
MERLVSSEIFSSAVCPLKCKYCYIPKSQAMQELQKSIISSLKSGTFTYSLFSIYGGDLENLGLWGAEPALTLKYLEPHLTELFSRFPKLKELGLSTNLMFSNLLFDFIKALTKQRECALSIQISLDGPSFVTDANRFKGASRKIPESFFELVSRLNSLELNNLKVKFSIKSTLTIDNVRMFNKDTRKISEYFDYFKTIENDFKKLNKNKQVTFVNSCFPTMCVPGRYTSEDGKEFALFLKNLRKLGYKSAYSFRLARLFDFKDELFTKPSMFTCSGGRSNAGLGIKNDLHICHRSFFLNHDEYLKSILKQDRMKNWDVSLFEEGKIDLINDRFVADITNEKERTRWQYVMRNYHDFTKLKNSYVIAMLKELALCGQADKKYLEDDDLCMMFAIFMNSANSCPMENIINTGCIHFTPVSLIRLWSNGAFQELLKERNCELSRRK